MALSESFLQELKDRNNISDIISGYVNVKRRGRNLVGLCPFHGEKTPSFNIYEETQSFYCFGCGAGGDVISFVMRIENLDYMEAVKFLAQRAGITVPQADYDDSMAKLKVRVLEANRAAAKFYHYSLYSKEGENGLTYLRGRVLSEKTIKRFGLGFSPENRFSLCNHLKSLGFTNSEMVAANLANYSKNGTSVYDRFNNRVMFPIIDLRGNVIAFGGRIMTDQKPKYLNTSDTVVFKKSMNLFSLNNAKNSGLRTLILCEGYMDVIAVNQAGFTNAVATLGTSLTSEQALIMKKYADEVIICYDEDEAGQKATARAIGMLRNAGIDVKVLTLPNGKDPDEFLRNKGENGPAAFKNILENCGNDVEYRLFKLKSKYSTETAEGKVAFLTEAAKLLASLDNDIEREVYASKLAGELKVEKASILSQVERYSKSKNKQDEKKEFRKIQAELSGRNDKVNTEKSKYLRATTAEEMIIAFVVLNPDKALEVKAKLKPEQMITSFNKKVYSYVLEKISSGCDPLIGISAEFTPDECSKITSFTVAKADTGTVNYNAMTESVNIVLNQPNVLSAQKAKDLTPEEINEMILKKLKKNKSY